MEFRILGSVEVSEHSRSISLGGRKQRAIFAHLLLRANNLVPTEVLIDEVWGEEPPAAVRSALQAYASHLRKALGPRRLEGSRAGYVLRAEPAEVDAVRFQSLIRDARRLMAVDPKAAVAVFDDALALWRGAALADLASESSLRAEAVRLDELRLAAIEDRIEALLAIGEHAQVIGELEGLTGRHPLRERLWGQLMLSLYRAGRQADALGSYQRAREILADELGIDPSPDLRRLHERILQQSHDLEIGGAPLRGYRLLERVGVGSFGTVYRAIQPEVRRDVAVKAIHPHLANDPDFIRRFEAEAQLIARLEHPHIIPLYDYWREPGGAYLVMRLLRGGSLAEALDEGALETERVARLMDQVSSALAAAHREGVIHRDVKPSNILFDDEGNAYLADFGIAKDLLSPEMTEPGAVKGSLLYLAPEQIRGEAITPRTDVYALGIVLYEVLVGEHPFRDVPDMAVYESQLRDPLPSTRSRSPDLPPALDVVIGTATAKDPDLRFPDTLTLAAAFRNALFPSDASVAVSAPLEGRNPYKGLRPFEEPDAHDFYGREALVDRLLRRWRRAGAQGRFLAVVGPSGIGKSSAVRAGLMPALRRGGIEGSEGWFITEMVPSRHPLEELEAALLRIAAQPPAGLLQVLESGPRGLLEAIDRVVPNGSELVLVVDQFEEVFTLTEDESERSLLLESLRVAAADPASRARIVATLRADFYDRPLNYPRFGPLLGACTEVMTPLAPDELERAIVRPAGSVGLTVEPALVAQVASDVAEQPGALPLVQYALTELFERRDVGTLTLAAYRDIGGIGGALAARGEQLYAARDAVGREAVRQLFLRLVTLGEGASDTRRRVPLSELSGIEVEPDAMRSALDAFGRHRLLTFDRDPATREPTVEVAHEALLRSWPRLRQWVDSAREDVRTLRRLADGAVEWERSGRDPSFLLRGSRLDQFEAWAERTEVAAGRNEQAYLRASVAKREEERAAEAARSDREHALERRSVKRLRGLVAVFAVAALVAGSLTIIATNQGRHAERESRMATARELTAAAVANLDDDPERSVLLALEAVETTRLVDGTVLPDAEEALHLALQQHRLVLTLPGYRGRFSSDGSRLLVVRTKERRQTGRTEVGVYDADTGELMSTADGPGGGGAAFSADGELFVTAGWGDVENATVIKTATGQVLSRLEIPDEKPTIPLALSPDGKFLTTSDTGNFTDVWDLGSGKRVRRPFFTGPAAFSPDGRQLLIADNFVEERRQWLYLSTHVGDGGRGGYLSLLYDKEAISQINGVAWSADGSKLAVSTSEKAIVWNAATHERLFTLFSPAGAFTALDLGPGSRLATGISDGSAIVWRLSDEGAQPILRLAGHDAQVGSVSFSPDGTRLMTGSDDGTIKVWDLTSERGSEWLTVEGSGAVAFSPDGRLLATGSEAGEISIFDAASGRRLGVIQGHTAKINALDFDPSGSMLASASNDGTARIWDPSSGEKLARVDERFDQVWEVAFSPDGSTLATGTTAGDSTHLWDPETGELLQGFPEDPYDAGWPRSVDFSRDGKLVAGEEFSSARVWTVDDAQILAEIPQQLVNALAFSRDGNRLVTGAKDGTIRSWDPRTGRQLDALTGNLGEVTDLVFSPDGTKIATSSSDGTVRLWDGRTLDPIMTLATDAKGKIAFSPDGMRLAYTASDGVVRVLALDLDDLIELANSRLTRSWTKDECTTYLHLDHCPSVAV